MKIITELKKKDLSSPARPQGSSRSGGAVALVRVDYNVPIKKGQVVDAFRIEQSLPTINYLIGKGTRVILISHAGSDGRQSLAPMAKYLNKVFPTKLIKGLDSKKINLALNSGQIVLLENIRRHEGEKKNDLQFAKELAGLADLYINDAFSVSHRDHASVSAITKYLPSYAGLLFAKEFKNLSLALKPKGKMVVILGGLKFQTKIPLIKKFLKTADQIFIGGALANSFMKAMGCDIGNSIADDDISYIKPLLKSKKIILPLDLVINKKNQIVDIGEESLEQIKTMIKGAKLIVWNGPMGWFEKGEKKGTVGVAEILSKTKAYVIVGGGDTLSTIKNLKSEKFGLGSTKPLAKSAFVSTAGGAMLDFLATGTLPGIKALNSPRLRTLSF